MTGNPRFKSQQKQEIVLSSETSRPTLGPTQPHIKWVQGALTSGAKTFECEDDTHLHQEVRLGMRGAVSPLSIYAWMACYGTLLLLYQKAQNTLNSTKCNMLIITLHCFHLFHVSTAPKWHLVHHSALFLRWTRAPVPHAIWDCCFCT